MTMIPHSLSRAAQNAVESSAVLTDPAALRGKSRPQLRRYEASTLLPNGEIADTRHIAPALPLFEDAFCAFSRGTMIDTEMGPMAIEDILPGDRVLTQNGDYMPVMWKGSTNVVPRRVDPTGRSLRLTRIMADSFGMQRPLSYIMAGPSARILKTPGRLQALAGGKPMLTPVEEFQDGTNVIDTAPPTAVQLFHICLSQHAIINVAGLEFETYHPGVNALRTMSHSMRSIYLGLFGHIDKLTDFGPQVFPRAGEGQIDAI